MERFNHAIRFRIKYSILRTCGWVGSWGGGGEAMGMSEWMSGTRRIGAIGLVLLLVACGGGGTTPVPTSLPVPTLPTAPIVTGPRANSDKIDEVFSQLLTIYQSQGLDAATQFARDQGLLTSQNEVRVTLILDSDEMSVAAGVTSDVMRLGGRVTATAGDEMEIVVPLQTLLDYARMMNRQNFFADLASFPHVRDIRRTPVAQPRQRISGGAGGATASAGATSEGVKVTGADTWQAAGITGKGVKVGVIDGSFNHYTQVLASVQVTAKSFRSDGLIEESDTDSDTIHGTACAEIVHEVAPDATLFLAATDTPGSFANAVSYLVRTAGVSVITTSVGWNTFQLNGTSVVAKAVDSARAAGVFFTVAAGNDAGGKIGSDEASGHFAATFADADGDGYHDFAGAKTRNGLTVRVGKDPIQIFFSWADWDRPHVNYDLYLLDRTGREAARSTIDQSRTGKPPLEVIRGKVPEGTYTLKLRKVNADDANLPFDLFFYGVQFEQTTPGGSLDSPADAQGAVTVAAVDWKTLTLENYSSQGPTGDGRKKPDLSAPDHVSNEAYASVRGKFFAGTSASAPHVGGAAVLYRQAFPKATPDDVLNYFVKNAKKPAGMRAGENFTGAGTLFLGVVPGGASTMPAPGTVIAAPPPLTMAQPTTATRVAFTDPFTMPTTGLPPGGYMNGAYHLTVSAGTGQTVTYGTSLNAPRATYEVTAQRASGASDAAMGLVVRQQDAKNYLAFAATNDGAFTVTATVGARVVTVVPATKNAAVRANAANTLRVTADGTVFTFAVNNQVVAVVDIRDVWRDGNYGLIGTGDSSAGADLSFTRFSVTTG